MSLADLKKNYSKNDIKFCRNDRKLDLMKKYYDIHGHEPHESFLYVFLCLIYDGHNSLESIKKDLRLIFISSTKQAVIEDEDIEEYYKQAKRKELISINENRITLTKTGKELVETSYYWNLHTSHWMGIFFSIWDSLE